MAAGRTLKDVLDDYPHLEREDILPAVRFAGSSRDYFRSRARGANRVKTMRILGKAGKGNPPVARDKLPRDWVPIKIVSKSPKSPDEKTHQDKTKERFANPLRDICAIVVATESVYFLFS
jgi:hypothetical protein